MLQAKTKCYWGLQQLCKSCRTCFKFYCMFYFTCDRSFKLELKAKPWQYQAWWPPVGWIKTAVLVFAVRVDQVQHIRSKYAGDFVFNAFFRLHDDVKDVLLRSVRILATRSRIFRNFDVLSRHFGGGAGLGEGPEISGWILIIY